jgi:hypothetical protein
MSEAEIALHVSLDQLIMRAWTLLIVIIVLASMVVLMVWWQGRRK